MLAMHGAGHDADRYAHEKGRVVRCTIVSHQMVSPPDGGKTLLSGTGQELRRQCRRLLGFLYIFLWVKRTNFRVLIAERAAWLVLVASLALLLLEVGLEIAPHQDLAGLAYFKAVYILALVLALYGKYREWQQQKQEYYFADAAKEIVGLLWRPQPDRQEETIYGLLAIFTRTFTRCDASVSVSLPDTNGHLVVRYDYGNAKSDKLFRLSPGSGAAGYCCQEQSLVYVPRRTIGHAILQNLEDPHPFHLKTDLYEPDGVEDFECILSVPIVAYGTCFGSLNLTSREPNAFRRLDRHYAIFYGHVLAQLLRTQKGVAGHQVTAVTGNA